MGGFLAALVLLGISLLLVLYTCAQDAEEVGLLFGGVVCWWLLMLLLHSLPYFWIVMPLGLDAYLGFGQWFILFPITYIQLTEWALRRYEDECGFG